MTSESFCTMAKGLELKSLGTQTPVFCPTSCVPSFLKKWCEFNILLVTTIEAGEIILECSPTVCERCPGGRDSQLGTFKYTETNHLG